MTTMIEETKTTMNKEPEGLTDRDRKLRLLCQQYRVWIDVRTAAVNRIKSAVRRELLSKSDGNLFVADEGRPLRKMANGVMRDATTMIAEYPVYAEWLKHIRGVGPTLAAQFISLCVPIARFATVSKLWAYAGMHCMRDGKAAKRKRGQKANWNSTLKTTCYVAADCFVKIRGCYYRGVYDRYKARDRAVHPDKVLISGSGEDAVYAYSDGHIHARAMRYAAKMFLSHLWEAWRTVEGLPVRPAYPVEYLGHDTHVRPWVAMEHDIASLGDGDAEEFEP